MGILVKNSDFGRIYGISRTEYFKNDYLTFTALEDGQFTLKLPATITATHIAKVSYKVNEGEWVETLNDNTAKTITVANIKAGDKVQWKGTGTRFSIADGKYSNFASTCKFDVSGNILSLIYNDDFAEHNELQATFTFNRLFINCVNLINAQYLSLPVDTLTNECYTAMFYGCSSLITAPELPATTLAVACYMGMFNGCSSLIEQPELPATRMDLYCYNCMFQNCSSLTKVHKLPQCELADGCWSGMFYGTPLRTYYDLKYTTPVDNCFNMMFAECTAMTKAPVIHLTSTIDEAIGEIFSGCTSLCEVEIYIPKPELKDNNYFVDTMWLKDVAASGVLKVHTTSESDMEKWNSAEAVNINCVPEGWTVEFLR